MPAPSPSRPTARLRFRCWGLAHDAHTIFAIVVLGAVVKWNRRSPARLREGDLNRAGDNAANVIDGGTRRLVYNPGIRKIGSQHFAHGVSKRVIEAYLP